MHTHTHTHTHKHIPHVFVPHISLSPTLLWVLRDDAGLSFHLLSLSSSHFIFHLQLISRALLSSHSTIIWHSLFFLSIPIVYPSITKLKRDAAESWNMYLVILKMKLIQAWKKYPEERCNAQMLLLHHSWDLIVHSVMINLKLKHVFFSS